MGYIIDIIVVVILGITILRGLRDGFIKSVMRLVSVVLAAVIAWSLSGVVSDFLYDKVFHTGVTNAVTSAIKGITDKLDLDSLVNGENEELKKILERYGLSAEEAKSAYDEANESGSNDVVEKFASEISANAARSISKVAAFAGVFIIAFILLKILSMILDSIFSSKILAGLNRWGGLAFGIATGILWSILVIIAAKAIEPTLCSMYPEVFAKSFSETSIIIRVFEWVRGLFAGK